MLRDRLGTAMFVWQRQQFRADNQLGVNCAVFRNESGVQSSELIRQAVNIANHVWPGERLYTFIGKDIRSTNPGYCYLKAGWTPAGYTKKGLRILEHLDDKQTRTETQEPSVETGHDQSTKTEKETT